MCEAPATEGGSLQKNGNVAVGEVYTFTCDEGTSTITDGFYGPICILSNIIYINIDHCIGVLDKQCVGGVFKELIAIGYINYILSF